MPRGRPLEVEQELVEAFKHSGEVTEYLARVLPVAIWRLPPPGERGRTIAAVIAHIQGVRRTFARMAGCTPVRRRWTNSASHHSKRPVRCDSPLPTSPLCSKRLF